MTVSTSTNKIIQFADGTTSTFSFPFDVRSGGQTDIEVFLTATDGTITQLTYSTQYTVTLNAAVSPDPTPVGGQVSLVSIPSNGTLVTILRTSAETQTQSLANQGTLYQPVIEAMVDQVTMLVQQVSELQGRAISVAVSDNAPTNLPPAAQRANLAMGFDASGNPTAISSAPAGTISSAMAPFVGAASIAAAKALLGYGSMANENIGAAGKGVYDDGSGNALVKHLISAVATNQSPASANHMTDYVASGTLIFTLPKLTAVFNGYELWVFCVSGTSTLSPNAADNFPGAAGGASIVLTAGQWARLIGDGVSAWQISAGRIPGIGSTQTKQVLTSGTAATYTTPAGCRRISIRMIGGGGGGGQNSGGATDGTAGGDTSFNSIVAKGGSPGLHAGSTTTAGAAGAGGTGGGGAANYRQNGSDGASGNVGGAAAGTWALAGGRGGTSPFGGVSTNSGGGGGGQSLSVVASQAASGGGGGSGEYVELIINNPAATYTYTVGAAGTAGAGASAGQVGLIIVDEYY